MKNLQRLAAIGTFCLQFVAAARAEQPAGAATYHGECTIAASAYDEIVAAHQQDEWSQLQQKTRSLIKGCTFQDRAGQAYSGPNLARDYVGFSLIAKNLKGEPVELHFLVAPKETEPYARTLPGLTSHGASLSPKFYELLVAPSSGYGFGVQYSIERVADPVSAQTAAYLKKAFDIARIAAGGLAIKSLPGEETRPTRVEALLVEVTLPFSRATITAEHLITGGDIPADKPLSATVLYRNAPPRRWTYGLLIGAMAGSKAADRAKVESNVLSADPLPSTLSMAIVNIHPKPYDETLQKPSRSERFRFFAGTVLTPGFGLGCGVGLGVVRGLALNAGGAVFMTRRLRKDDSFGSAPKDPNHATRTGYGATLFVGMSYGFE